MKHVRALGVSEPNTSELNSGSLSATWGSLSSQHLVLMTNRPYLHTTNLRLHH